MWLMNELRVQARRRSGNEDRPAKRSQRTSDNEGGTDGSEPTLEFELVILEELVPTPEVIATLTAEGCIEPMTSCRQRVQAI